MTTYRYTISRLCLSEGSMRLHKSLEPLFADLSGSLTFRDDQGLDFEVNLDCAAHKISGLSEFYLRSDLKVNDIVQLVKLADRKFQLEALLKHPKTTERITVSPVPQRVILEENAYLREVRTERPVALPTATAKRTGKVDFAPLVVAERPSFFSAPIPSGLAGLTSSRPTPGPIQRSSEQVIPEKSTLQSTGQSTGQSNPALQVKVASLSNHQRALLSRPFPSTGREEVVSFSSQTQAQAQEHAQAQNTPQVVPQVVSQIMPQVIPQVVSQIMPQVKTPEPTLEPVLANIPTPTPARKSRPEVQLLERFADQIGYTLHPYGEQVLLEAKLGRQAYRVAVAFPSITGLVNWERLQALGSEYSAVITSNPSEVTLPPDLHICVVLPEALEELLVSSQLSPLTPLELRDAWAQEKIDLEAAGHIAETASRQLGERGIFSHVLLSLAEFENQSSFTFAELMGHLAGRISKTELSGILETLCQPPFLTLSRLGADEYYLRQPIGECLNGLCDYASSLNLRVRKYVEKAPTAFRKVLVRS